MLRAYCAIFIQIFVCFFDQVFLAYIDCPSFCTKKHKKATDTLLHQVTMQKLMCLHEAVSFFKNIKF